MEIRGYLQTSLVEWPGKIASVVFTTGCNFRCPFCHNAFLVDPKKMDRIGRISEKEILADLEKRKKWLDGIVVTGGEPLLQADLGRFLKLCHQLGLKTMVETNGSWPKRLEKLIKNKQLDYVAMDIKFPLFKNYGQKARVRGRPDGIAEKVKASLKLIMTSGLPFELRTTVVPGIHDERTLVRIAQQIKKMTSQETKWFLQAFQPKNCLDPKFEKIKPLSEKEMRQFLRAAKAFLPQAALRSF